MEHMIDSHLTVILVFVVGAGPINNFPSRDAENSPSTTIDMFFSVYIRPAILDAVNC